jgi:hypothetical protein
MSSDQSLPKFPTKLPFAWVSLGWLFLAVLVCLLSNIPTPVALPWLLGFWVLCVLDLFAIAETVEAVVRLQALKEGQDKLALVTRAFFWGFVKLACLGFLGLAVWVGRGVPNITLIFGLGTLVVVPLVGGLLWSQKELRYA